MAEPLNKIDPIRDKYFKPLERAERWNDLLFYFSAFLSLAALLVEKPVYPRLYDLVQIAFILSVIALFALGLVIRLYLFPRSHKRRLQDFLSIAHGIPLSHEQTSGYYNNSATDPETRKAAQLLENSFHSKAIIQAMAGQERLKALLYVVIWIIALLIRSTNLALAGIIAQVVFSEQLLSRFFRIEWFRVQCEKVYADLFRLFQSRAEPQRFTILVQELLVEYETAKTNATITLSGALFERERVRLAREWEEVRTALGL